MSWVLLVLIFGLGFSRGISADGKQHQSPVVVGTVCCETSSPQDFPKTTHFIPGASVAVECPGGKSEPSFRQEVKTDEHGEFRVVLPLSVAKHLKKIKRCSVTLLRSPDRYCSAASAAAYLSSLRLKSRKQGTRIFSAGFFTFRSEKPINQGDSKNGLGLTDPSFPPPIPDPVIPGPTPLIPLLPPLPNLPSLPPLPPLPRLPLLPPLPGINPPEPTVSRIPTTDEKEASLNDKKLEVGPSNPFLAPP